MKDIMFSIVTIANKKDVFDDFVKNLKEQIDITYELIVINNYNKEYNSARAAYNSALPKLKGEFTIFLHPDIRFFEIKTLKKIYDYINQKDEFGVIGVAGSPEKLENNKRILYSNIFHGKNKFHAGRTFNEIMEVQTVDECLFIVKTVNIINYKFSSKEGWHLYSVELCLQMKYIYNKKNYIIPIELWHMSDGSSLDNSYLLTLDLLKNEYMNRVTYINTTVRKWKCKDSLFYIKILPFKMIQKLKKYKYINKISYYKRYVRDRVKERKIGKNRE